MITIILNGNKKNIEPETNLINLIEQLNLQKNSFAIAINEIFIPKSDYSSIKINENDHIEIVTAMQGG